MSSMTYKDKKRKTDHHVKGMGEQHVTEKSWKCKMKNAGK